MDSVLSKTLQHAERDPERLCALAVSTRHGDARRSFGEVVAAAARAAGFLHARGVVRGDVVVLIGTHDPDLYAAWLGVVWLGAVPTILAEPSVRVDRAVFAARLRVLLDRACARVVLLSARVAAAGLELGAVPRFGYDELAAGDGPVPAPLAPAGDDLLLLQHSSGTTGLHKGVMLTHGAVMHHAASYATVLAPRDDDRIVSWLPLYHDMGLIACFVSPLIAGTPVIWLSPFEWVAAPSLLLRAAHEHRATLMWLPNFALQVLATRTREPAGTFDLTAVRAVINCSEPVTEEAMSAFAARFAADGLRADALQACYAMAENVFAVTSARRDDPPRMLRARRDLWRAEHRVAPPDDGGPTVSLVSSGRPIPDCDVRIVGDDGAPLPPLAAGRVLVRSPFLFSGYFRRDDLNTGLRDADGFFDTGDVGLVDADGHLFVSARRKDIVIVGGRNVYPQDVEQVAAEIEGVRAGRVVCFGVEIRGLGTEGLVLLFESDEPSEQWSELARRLRVAVPSRLDLDLVDVRAVPRGELRKSTSGKLARSGNREWYLDGRFGTPPANVLRTQET
jgi:fatty-acyl-CoA synthase